MTLIEDYGKLVIFDILDCHSCNDVSFNMPSRRVNHMFEKHRYHEGKYENLRCPQCPNLQLPESSNNFLSHLMEHESRKYKNMTMKKKKKIEKHIAADGSEIFKCPYEKCYKKEFFYLKQIQKHLQWHNKGNVVL